MRSSFRSGIPTILPQPKGQAIAQGNVLSITHIFCIHPRMGVGACSPGQAKRSPGKAVMDIVPLKGVRAVL